MCANYSIVILFFFYSVQETGVRKTHAQYRTQIYRTQIIQDANIQDANIQNANIQDANIQQCKWEGTFIFVSFFITRAGPTI